MIPFPLKLILFCAFIPSDIFYVTLLYTIYKSRSTPPFNSSFFKLAFNLGLFDLIFINDMWLLARLPMFAWFGMDKVVMLAPRVLATFMEFIAWFSALGQVSAVALLAANRVSVIGFHWIWPEKLVRITIILLWTIPFVICFPQVFVGHKSYTNHSTVEGVMYYWLDQKALKVYFTGCIFFCIASASISGVFYAITFYRIKQQKADSALSGSPESSNIKTEIKLAITGVVLFVLTIVYAVYCAVYAFFGSDQAMIPYINTFQVIHGDIYSWSNPYLLMMSSPAARENFWKVIKGSRSTNNEVRPTHQGAQDEIVLEDFSN